jgi:hypothetical protein
MKHQKLSASSAIKNWMFVHRMNTRILKHYIHRSKVFYLKYEDLCKDLNKKLEEIFDFIGVSSIIQTGEISADGLHIIGNIMRKKFSGHVRLDEKWKKELDECDLKLFEEKAGKQNRKLGYI